MLPSICFHNFLPACKHHYMGKRLCIERAAQSHRCYNNQKLWTDRTLRSNLLQKFGVKPYLHHTTNAEVSISYGDYLLQTQIWLFQGHFCSLDRQKGSFLFDPSTQFPCQNLLEVISLLEFLSSELLCQC